MSSDVSTLYTSYVCTYIVYKFNVMIAVCNNPPLRLAYHCQSVTNYDPSTFRSPFTMLWPTVAIWPPLALGF